MSRWALGLLTLVVAVSEAPSHAHGQVKVEGDETCLVQVTLGVAHGNGRSSGKRSKLTGATLPHGSTKASATLPGKTVLQDGRHFPMFVWMGIPIAVVCASLLPTIVHDLRLILGRQKNTESHKQRAGIPSSSDVEDKDRVLVEAALESSPQLQAASPFSTPQVSNALIVVLTLPDFYHGCLLSTFMPYLLAEEGPRMAGSASLFMGSAKAVFALSVALLPAMGQFSDWWVDATSHAVGRRFALFIGILGCVLGTCGCAVASEVRCIFCYYMSVFLMRLGTDCFNVANEALVLELVPESQFDIASGVKGAMFFIGSVISFVAVICVQLPPSWLYYFYTVVALACVLPAAMFLIFNEDTASCRASEPAVDEDSVFRTLQNAYTRPMGYAGCFPGLCIASFVYHVGLAPMFMLLLQLHDIVGMRGHSKIKTEWGYISLVSTALGAVSSIIFALQVQKDKNVLSQAETRTNILSRLKPWALAGSILGALIPVIALFGEPGSTVRLVLMYVIGGAMFWCVGVVQALFQEAVWMFLPAGAQLANAMGFLVACHVTGVGVGSLGGGIILQIWAIGENSYDVMGYAVLSLACLILGLLSVWLIPESEEEPS